MTGKPSTRRPALTLFEMLSVIGVGIVLLMCLLPALMPRRGGPSPRLLCRKHNLRQIVLGLQNYSDAYGSLPPAYTVDAKGNPLHSWRTLILPYMDQAPLYQTIDLTKPWNDPANATAFNTAIRIYQCPSSFRLPPNYTTYLAISSPRACFYREKPRKLSEISDGLSETLIVIEVPLDKSIPWMEPTDADESLFLGIDTKSALAHSDVFHTAFADGRDFSLPADSPVWYRRARLTISGNEKVVDPYR